MPVVTVAAPPHAEIRGLLHVLADAVAAALGLGDGDVIACHLPASAGVASGGADAVWPVVSVYGSDRGGGATAAALAAAKDAVLGWASSSDVRYEGVWAEWIVPEPAR